MVDCLNYKCCVQETKTICILENAIVSRANIVVTGDLVIKNTYCSFRGLKFSSQHPHDSLQTSGTLVTRDLMPSSSFLGNNAGTWHIHTEIGKC